MSTELYRKYIDIINENSQDRIQLDEGMMDKFNPYIKKMANALMSKLDPETLKGLKQAYDQSGGDKNKFMQLVGITKQDLEPLVQANMSEGAFTGTGKDLKSKVLTALANIIPLTGILDFFTGSNAYNMLKASGVEPLAFLWYCAAVALMWGIGSYNFDKKLDKEQLDEYE